MAKRKLKLSEHLRNHQKKQAKEKKEGSNEPQKPLASGALDKYPFHVLNRHPTAPRIAYPIPYFVRSKILLVGEGNFSFAVALVRALRPPGSEQAISLTATCFESRPELLQKYPEAAAHIDTILQHGGCVYYSVDATKLDKDKRLMAHPWTRIIFNFPHTGRFQTSI